MGPRPGGGGAQQGFVQRKAALSKPSRLRTSDFTADGLTPRGPGRYSSLIISLFIILQCVWRPKKLKQLFCSVNVVLVLVLLLLIFWLR